MPSTKTLALVALTLGALVAARPMADAYARHQLDQRYPWVHPREVRVQSFHEVELRDVTFDRGWVKGQLTRVMLDVSARAAHAEGGHVDVYLDARPASSGKKGERKKRGPRSPALIKPAC